MSTPRKPVVGDVLVRQLPARRGTPERIDEVRVTKVGRKYFSVVTVSHGYTCPEFELRDWGRRDTGHNERTNFPQWLFEDMETLEKHKRESADRSKFAEWLRSSQWSNKLTIDQQRRILAITEEGGEP